MAALRLHRRLVALLGSTLFAAGGFWMGSMNVGWFGLEENANSLFPLLGLGAALVVGGLSSSPLAKGLHSRGVLERATRILMVAAPLVYLLSWLVEFAILGTLALGLGLICLTVIVIRRRWLPPIDRLLVAVSAVAALTWNTETVSAFLLVGVGLVWAILSMRPLAIPALEGGSIPG